jgi:predicted phosphoribosyltransferase
VARRDVFGDRVDAGQALAALLATVDLPPDAVVAGIPRGGVVVAAEVARVRGVSTRAVVARKVGAPGHEELAVGAVGPDGIAVLDDELLRRLAVSASWVEAAVERGRRDVADRLTTLPGVLTGDDVRDRTVIVVDDGLATGATALAVGRWLAHGGAGRRVLALPVAPADTAARLGTEYNDVIVLRTPPDFVAVGQWYREFGQVDDATVRSLLRA